MDIATLMMAPHWLNTRNVDGVGPTKLTEAAVMNEASKTDKQNLQSILFNQQLEVVMETRVVRVIFGALSSALAAYVIYLVWHDSWRGSKLVPRPHASRFSFLWRIHVAEVFPIILSFTIFITSMTLVGVQANAMNAVVVKQCRNNGSIALPAILAVGFLHIVFGAEATLRVLKINLFKSRRTLAMIFNMLIFVGLVLSTFGIARAFGRSRKVCVGTITFRISSLNLERGIIGAISSIILSCLTMASIIAVQLLRTIHLDPNERIAGSRMFYYLLTTALLQIFILPFFIQDFLGVMDKNFTSANIAEYLFFSSGAVLAMVHLFLRANAGRTAIKPRETPWQKRRRFRFFGPNDLEIMNISPPLNLVDPNFRPDEKVSEIFAKRQPSVQSPSTRTPLPKFSYPQKPFGASGAKLPATPPPSWPVADDDFPPLPATPSSKPPKPAAKSLGHKRQQSYTLFPGEDELKLPATVYSPPSAKNNAKPPLRVQQVTLAPAAAVFNATPSITDIIQNPFDVDTGLEPPDAPWLHRRGSSAESSRTVQIGLRLSSAGSERVASTRQSTAQLPRMGNFVEEGGSSVTSSGAFDGFSPAFRELLAEATGRDLNSFRWIDTPSDEVPRSGSRLASGPLLGADVYVPPSSSKTSARNGAASPATLDSAVSAPETKAKGWI